ncbi:Cytochrome P450 4F8 [Leucoagaricus sp. SymC.cos]|nr:Cytochrome P450 4F8 [Leucoagaricus sp. SymC.cos]
MNTGNVQQLFADHGWKFYYDTLERYGSVTKMKGLFGENMLFICDPKALHHILVKDQHIYEEATAFIATNKLMFGEGLLAVLGEQHRKQRKMLTPVFSIAHMRATTPVFYEVTHRLRQALLTQVKDGPREVDILHWMSRTALELIGQSGMGYSFDSLENDNAGADLHPYSRSVKRFGGFLTGISVFIICNYLFPLANQLNFPRTKRWIVEHIPSQWVQDMKDIADIMEETARDICRSKQEAILKGESDGGEKDIISILMRANASAAEEDKLTDEEVVAQVATLVFAAMDTTSSALSRILSLLVTHPHVQEKLRAELLEARRDNGGEDLSYDELVTLPYLDAVCRETLRVYPPLGTASRNVRKDMVLPLSKPLRTTSGTEVTELIVPNGATVFISIIGANTNPEIWGPDSYEWKPERWLKPLPEKVGAAHMPGIYSNLMTFLGGSRACIGFKFSQLEMKVVLSILLTSFKFEDTGKTILWKMPGIASPVVEGKDVTRPALPIILSSLEEQ